ncbi:unnamed protein product [Vitrella brassicaformis CCMP3155]|uniref:Uncharacterized protein n=1 Tax=Vitrella brassicaformis (strain CCMP3155) TaxID=1169540 RepID=A0A0G4GKT3_VITBC|nr:unnamed protein product [Vitrella brassicaformis CCMP3155]|mmetsp:Transcript_44562/g.110882  ORF Transcript_44562/g.110882 Transcript_44562/m.110882 type:complete len:317 (-) Transcript_44562:157-1107(-)|eukprot:CEM30633.1 unnamed protein product [Vitrella brassicaformis CCMP3155]
MANATPSLGEIGTSALRPKPHQEDLTVAATGRALKGSNSLYQSMTAILLHILLIVVVETVFFFAYVSRRETASFNRDLHSTAFVAARTIVKELNQTATGQHLLWAAQYALTDAARRQQIEQQVLLGIVRRDGSGNASSGLWQGLFENSNETLEGKDRVGSFLREFLLDKREKAIAHGRRRLDANSRLLHQAIWFNVISALVVLSWTFGTPRLWAKARPQDLDWASILRDNTLLLLLLSIFEFAFFLLFVSQYKVTSNDESAHFLMETMLVYLAQSPVADRPTEIRIRIGGGEREIPLGKAIEAVYAHLSKGKHDSS